MDVKSEGFIELLMLKEDVEFRSLYPFPRETITNSKEKNKQKSSMIPVEGHKNLFRDEKTNAIINTDTIGYENYMRMRKRNNDKQAENGCYEKGT